MGPAVPVQGEGRALRSCQNGSAGRLAQLGRSGDPGGELIAESVARAFARIELIGRLQRRKFILVHQSSLEPGTCKWTGEIRFCRPRGDESRKHGALVL